MLFAHHAILLRGGDLGTGVAYRLHHAGFPVIVTELPHPLPVVRWHVPLAPAVVAALHDATGVWFDEIPLLPWKVVEGLK